jgi:serine phosphatase RsbU (regulator of sigma subunit)
VATLRDWMALASTTFRDLENRQVTGLYRVEWPEVKRTLIADHRLAIEGEPSGLKRFFRTASAILFGVTTRLAPQRRLLFIGAQLLLLFAFVSLVSGAYHDAQHYTWTALAGAFLLITLLLGMELIDKLKFRDELELARELQASLLPTTIPQPEGFEIDAFNHIANTVGGDVYDFVELPDRRLAILFGDASGHGMAAGLIMAVAHAAFRTQLEVDPSPAAMAGTLNRILWRTGSRRSFFAGVYLLLDPDGRFEAFVAGHPPILLVRQGGAIEPVGTGSYPLGVKTNYSYQTVVGAIRPGEVLAFHSDGLSEARNEAGEEFGDERIANLCAWFGAGKASELVAALVNHWRRFSERVPVEDDVSIAIIRRRSAAAAGH